jgi:hypothetical protein
MKSLQIQNMKMKLLLFLFLFIHFSLNSQEISNMTRIYVIKTIAFYAISDIYCTFEPCGYYKYPQKVKDRTVYLTFEGSDFYKKSAFDENFYIFDPFIPSNMWSNKDGSVVNLKKNYSPVIEKNRERKNYPFGFGKN